MKNILVLATFAASLLISLNLAANDYPSKNIRLVVPFAAGGGTDAVARALADSSKTFLKANIVIVNRTGGAGAIGMSYGAQQKTDGYTLTVVTREIASLPQMGLMQHSLDDFQLIRMVNLDPAVILVAKNSPFNSIKDLIKAAKANQGTIPFASTATPNFYLMAFEKAVSVQLDAIPHNGAADALPSVVEGFTQITMVTPGEALAMLKSGKLKALGVMSDERIAYIPNVPTLKEQGLNITTGTWRGIAAPKGTPDDILKLLGNAFDQAMASPKFQKVMADGAMTHYPLKADEFTHFVEEDIKKVSELIN